MGKSNYQNIIQQINFYSLLLFIFWLPLKDDFLPVILALWIVSWLLEGNFKNRLKGFNNKAYYIGFALYFMITAAFILRANDLDEGWFQIQEKLSMVFFPFFLFGANNKIKSNKKLLLKIFVLGNLIAAIYCLGNAFFSNLVFTNDSFYIKHWAWDEHKDVPAWQLISEGHSVFSYVFLSIFKHPAYFSLYITFSILILIDFFKKGTIKKRMYKILSIVAICFFIFMLFLLQSRAAIVTFAIVLMAVPLIELKKHFKKRFLFLALTLALFAIIFALASTRLKTNLKEISNMLEENAQIELKEADIRIQLWYTSSLIIKENFWLGTAPANLTDELVKKYKELGFSIAANEKFNSHNQYLEAFAGLGILGLISLLYILVFTFIISLRRQHYLLFFMALILSVNFLFESMMNRMATILFMMFFISLFVFADRPQEKKA